MRPAAFAVAALLAAACGAPAGDEAANQSVLIDANIAEASRNAAAVPEAVADEPEPAAYSARTIPAAFHGDYDETEEACAQPSQYKLAVSASELRFHESIGTVRSVKVEAPGRIEVLADYQGEGESWQNLRRMELDGKKLSISGDGVQMVRTRCPAAKPT